MEGLKSMVIVLAVVMAASFQLQSVVAKTRNIRHVVGDSLGWTIPLGGANTYATWASQRTFVVGDTLVFNFPTGFHNVAEVSQAAYNPCTTTNTLSLDATGPTTITLTRPGPHYYICTVPAHCQIGQKLAINVSPSTAPSPQSTPGSRPSAIATSPSTLLSPIGSPFPSPSSASSALMAVVPATFLAVALTFFY